MEIATLRIRRHCIVNRCAEKITDTALPGLQDIYTRRCLSRAKIILKDCHYPGHNIFQWLPPGKWLRCQKARTERLRSFSPPPQAIRTMNAWFPSLHKLYFILFNPQPRSFFFLSTFLLSNLPQLGVAVAIPFHCFLFQKLRMWQINSWIFNLALDMYKNQCSYHILYLDVDIPTIL